MKIILPASAIALMSIEHIGTRKVSSYLFTSRSHMNELSLSYRFVDSYSMESYSFVDVFLQLLRHKVAIWNETCVRVNEV